MVHWIISCNSRYLNEEWQKIDQAQSNKRLPMRPVGGISIFTMTYPDRPGPAKKKSFPLNAGEGTAIIKQWGQTTTGKSFLQYGPLNNFVQF